MVLTGKNKNGDVLRVRCVCMDELVTPSRAFYNYDWLAEVDTLDEARAVYRQHLQDSRR
jgi:hypothetical protein